jgi:hypothetical protein
MPMFALARNNSSLLAGSPGRSTASLVGHLRPTDAFRAPCEGHGVLRDKGPAIASRRFQATALARTMLGTNAGGNEECGG